MYEQIKKLVEENKLSFADEHQTNAKQLLENNKELFLEQVKFSCDLYAFVKSKKKFPIFSEENCSHCGEHIQYYLKGEQFVPYHIEESKLVPAESNCVKEEEVIVEIPFPSGELIFADWIEHSEELVGHLDKKTIPIQFPKVKIKRSKDYAEKGFGHFYVGNTSPSVFQKENTIFIGHNSYDKNNKDILLDKEAKHMGMIDIDLWWVSVCDRKIYERMAIEKFGKEKGKEMTEAAVKDAKENHAVVQVEPGTYQLCYFTDIHDDTTLYATLEKRNEIK